PPPPPPTPPNTCDLLDREYARPPDVPAIALLRR
ncbi:MAG: hypothetical protein QOH83_994, partial [Solirubrobacteraceae bacterium]|nr:hypothetical protein [Solirubrobacteraceae bacterium]